MIIRTAIGYSAALRTKEPKRMGFWNFVVGLFFSFVVLIGMIGASILIIIFAPSPRFDNVRQTSWIWQQRAHVAPNEKIDGKNFERAVNYFNKLPAKVSKEKERALLKHVEAVSQLIEFSKNVWERPVDAPEKDFQVYFPETIEEFQQEDPSRLKASFRQWLPYDPYSVMNNVNWVDPYGSRLRVIKNIWDPMLKLIDKGISATVEEAPAANARLRLLRADSLYHINDFTGAAKEYDSVFSKPHAEIPVRVLLTALKRSAECDYFMMNFKKAKETYEHLLKSQQSGIMGSEQILLTPSDYLVSTSRLADCYRFLKDFDNAAMYYSYGYHPIKEEHRRAAVKSNQAMSYLYLCYVNSMMKSQITEEESRKITDDVMANIADGFPRNRYQGILMQDLSNVYWNHGDIIMSLLVRYTALCVRFGEGDGWDALPLYKHVRPTTWDNVVEELTGIKPQQSDN